MVQYSFEEYADMMLIYGEARCNGRAARAMYQERFPERVMPSHTIFEKVNRRLRESGTFVVSRVDTGAPRTRRTPAVEEAILHAVHEDPGTSTRIVARDVGVSQSVVWNVLHDQQLHPYHPQKVHAMGPTDFEPRVRFCTWFVRRCVNTPQFPQLVLFTDEAKFTREGVFNSRNSHVWDEENPFATKARGFQQRMGINVWAGILAGRLIGPYVLPTNLTGRTYLIFLQETLPEMLENVPLAIRQNMWFQHDGAPPHFARVVRDHLTHRYDRQWIGRAVPVPWPPRSPDLTPLDFFLWGCMKSLIYETPIESEHDLVARIVAAANFIRENPLVFNRLYENILRRYNVCIDVGGRHIEPLL